MWRKPETPQSQVKHSTAVIQALRSSANIKGADKTAQTCRLFSTFVVCMQQNQVVLAGGPYNLHFMFLTDFSNEKNPYQKIYIGIQDMKLDLMKSMVGDLAATERLKKSRL